MSLHIFVSLACKMRGVYAFSFFPFSYFGFITHVNHNKATCGIAETVKTEITADYQLLGNCVL